VYGSRDVASASQRVAAVVRNGVLRPGPDASYADGDDHTWMDIDWQPLQRPLEIFGRRVNVLDTGGGGDRPPLLFLHGWSSNWQIFLLNIAAFMKTHRCLALDLPGFGASEMPAESISIHGYARTGDAVCDALGVECVSVVGNSMGGFVGAELALSFDTRVDRLVLVSAAGLSTEHLAQTPAVVLARLVTAGVPYTRRFESHVVRRPRLRLAAMEIPVLIVWGRNDLLVPVGDAERYRRLIGENARVEVLDDTGHAPMIERPSRFNELLREFVAERATMPA
jgi:pimeloyl-ACP methyl ester carboxylesterase